METKTFDLERLFDLSPELLCIAGYDGFLKKINPAVSETLGYSLDELYHTPINHFVHPDDVKKTSAVREKLVNNNAIVNFENRYLTKSGKIVWLSWTAKAAKEDKLIFAIAKNITEKKKEESDKIKHIFTLSETNKNYEKLSYTTSHDLRAPIDNILAILEFVDKDQLNQENKKLIDLIATSTHSLKNRLCSYIDNLKNNEPVVNIKTVDFNNCLNEAIFPIKNLIKNSKLVLKTDFSAVKSATFNQSYLESIFLNLISNAIKYARPKVAPEVSITTKEVAGQIKLLVKDNGLGFNLEKTKNKIFKLHQTFHEHTDSKGIGLYLVNMQVTSLGGTITVDSEVNKGTTFTITFDKDLKV